ncbi:tail-specific protease, partial [Colwellia sp. BRX8-8]|nr:tail-specific protease [Colwellia sp. BRX8-8]
MLKICRIAIAVSLSLSAMNIFAVENLDKVESLPILAPESQHAASSKRVTAQFTRAHYSKVDMDDALSEKIFDRYIKQL